MGTINTPENRLTVVMLSMIAYLLSPLVFAIWIFDRFGDGEVSANADSIGIPIGEFVILWIVGFPLITAICVAFELIGCAESRRNMLEDKWACF